MTKTEKDLSNLTKFLSCFTYVLCFSLLIGIGTIAGIKVAEWTGSVWVTVPACIAFAIIPAMGLATIFHGKGCIETMRKLEAVAKA